MLDRFNKNHRKSMQNLMSEEPFHEDYPENQNQRRISTEDLHSLAKNYGQFGHKYRIINLRSVKHYRSSKRNASWF
eukprot:UN28954